MMLLSLRFLFLTAVSLSHGKTLQNVLALNALESTEGILGSRDNSANQFENGITNKKNTFSWEQVSSGTSLPDNAVVGGIDAACGKLYVARAEYNGYLVPGKYCENDGKTHINYKGSEIVVEKSEVLSSNEVYWQPTTGSRIPAEAIPVGNLTNGETLYAGRGFIGDYLTPGMVQPSTNTIKMAFGGNLYTSANYEILVRSPRAYRWETVLYPSSEIPDDAVIGGFDTVLCSNHILWEKTKNNEIPSNALEVGFTAEGEKLFSGRGFLRAKVLPGKIQPSDNLLYMTNHGRQHQTSEYEILTIV